MATQADIDKAIADLQAEVAADFATVNTQITTLTAELAAANGGTSAALDAAVKSITDTTAALHAKYTTPTP